MNAATIYISIAIVVLILIFIIFFIAKGKRKQKLSPLASIALLFVLASIFFGESRLTGYTLIGIGIIIAIIDIIIKSKKK